MTGDRVDPRHRPASGLWQVLLVIVLLTVLATRMVPHPVGAARTSAKFEGKAATTAKSALSDVQTVRLAVRTASAGNGFGPYLSGVISDAEESLSGVQGTFDSIQPPNASSDQVQSELDALLSTALGHVRDIRVATRRGEGSGLASDAAPLDQDASDLERFMEQHKS